MKLSQKKSLVSLVSACLLVGSYADSVVMKPNFKELSGYKNIAFGASIGGSSHVNWVLSIGEELGIRGHNVSFFTTVSDTNLYFFISFYLIYLCIRQAKPDLVNPFHMSKLLILAQLLTMI